MATEYDFMSDVYQCNTCQKYFERGNRRCLAWHPRGTCCHEYETSLIPSARVAYCAQQEIFNVSEMD